VQKRAQQNRGYEPDPATASELKDKKLHLVQSLSTRQKVTGHMARELDSLSHNKLSLQMFKHGVASSVETAGSKPRIKQMRE
jgi:hypothetical protein